MNKALFLAHFAKFLYERNCPYAYVAKATSELYIILTDIEEEET